MSSEFQKISKEDFKREIEKVCYLIGYSRPAPEQLRLFYEKVKQYDLRDFRKACDDDDVLRDLSKRRNLCWPTLHEAILKYQSRRLEEESLRRKRQEEKDWEEMPEDVKEFIDRLFGRKTFSAEN